MRNEQERAEGGKEFEKSIKDKTELFELIKEVLIDTTEKQFKKEGYEPSEGEAGMYGDEETYGAGTKAEKFIIKVSGKTLPSLEKTIQVGGKRLSSEITCVLQNDRLKINYNTPENTGMKNMIVRKEMSVSTNLSKKNLKKKLEDLFSEAAVLEVAYLQSASLGVEPGSQSYFNPNKPQMEIINNALTIKEIFTSESKDKTAFTPISPEEINPNKVIEKNTVKLEGDKMLLDKDAVDEIVQKVREDKSFQRFFKEALNKFECKSLGEVKEQGKDEEFLKELASFSLSEITAVGGGAAGAPATGVGGGAGAYLTPFFAKKGNKKKDLTGSFVEYAPEAKTQDGAGLKENTDLTKNIKETVYFQNQNTKRPKVDKDWNIVSEAGGDPYTVTVKIDPNTHPMGMPFVKPGSEEEAKLIAAGDPGKLKRIGVKKLDEAVEKVKNKIASETEEERIKRLSKKRFNSILENEERGINKRYIITEKTTKEFEKERMSKLAGFKLYETIHDAENLSEILGAEPEVELNSTNFSKKEDEEFLEKDPFDSEGVNNFPEDFELNQAPEQIEETVEVQKPGSVFGLTYKFKKKDYLNESKKYILDMNSMVFVPNPNLVK